MFGKKKVKKASKPFDLDAFYATLESGFAAVGEERPKLRLVEVVEQTSSTETSNKKEAVATDAAKEVPQPEKVDFEIMIATAVAEKVEPLQMEIIKLKKQLDEKQTLIGLITAENKELNELIEMIDSPDQPEVPQPDISVPECHTFKPE